jgi:hypothetical protein
MDVWVPVQVSGISVPGFVGKKNFTKAKRYEKERFSNAKQRESKAKVHPLARRWADSRNAVAEVVRPQAFIEVCRNGGGQSCEAGFCVLNSQTLGNVSVIPPRSLVGWGEGLWSGGGCYYLWAPGASGQQDTAVYHKPFF